MVERNIIEKIITDLIKTKCYTSFKYTNGKGEHITLRVREIKKPSTFVKHLHSARQTIPLRDRWRVLEPSYDHLEKYDGGRMFVSEHGSTIAVDKNNTIISVCSYKDSEGVSLDNAKALMNFAVSIGGDKLDTFDGNYPFYRYCGFSPISWIKFEEFDTSNIRDWEEGHRVNPSQFREEDIVFFKYTGETTPYVTANDFYSSVDSVSGDGAYERASSIRDNS